MICPTLMRNPPLGGARWEAPGLPESIDQHQQICQKCAVSRLLVIDDDEAMRRALARLLKEAGYDVTTAPDGAAGLAEYRAAPADLVIVDLYMPGKEGLETLVQLRREFPKAVVIAMSGNRNLDLMLRAAEKLGAVLTIAKPFEPGEMLTLVQKALA